MLRAREEDRAWQRINNRTYFDVADQLRVDGALRLEIENTLLRRLPVVSGVQNATFDLSYIEATKWLGFPHPPRIGS